MDILKIGGNWISLLVVWLGVKWLVAGSYLYEQSRVERDGAKRTRLEIVKKKKKKEKEKERKKEKKKNKK